MVIVNLGFNQGLNFLNLGLYKNTDFTNPGQKSFVIPPSMSINVVTSGLRDLQRYNIFFIRGVLKKRISVDV